MYTIFLDFILLFFFIIYQYLITPSHMHHISWKWNHLVSGATPRLIQSGHKTTLIKKKKKYIYIYIYTREKRESKSTYFDHPNKNSKHPNLKITKN